MADVRSLLRNERASRRITHHHASYSATGALSCRVCQIPLKSDSLWDLHVKSPAHLRLQTQDQKVQATSKKRKADDSEELTDLRKRPRAKNGLPEGFFDTGSARDDEEDQDIEEIEKENITDLQDPKALISAAKISKPAPIRSTSGASSRLFEPPALITTTDPKPAINETEWAAFERDIATPPPSPPSNQAMSALIAAATITAEPLTAAEIAARSREEASTQAKEKREAELEGEKEDASRRLEEEFDEMEELESRVRRLREKREEIRRKKAEGAKMMIEVPGEGSGLTLREEQNQQDESDDEEEEGENVWTGWGIH
ncbi:hypothetical protein MMC19_006212 [Ptychographa xylographoides]|nr:hypothetical protein [Ptychographa xylographoides]